jgi:hypothetical protein
MAAASHLGLPAWQVAAGTVPAAAFSAGPTSPDVDNTRLWKRLDRWVPDEWLGDGGPLGHRELMHFWGLPAALAWVMWTVGAPWFAWAAVVGWVSHIGGDLLVGQEGYGTQRGVPLGPWWWHVGVGLKCGGAGEWLVTALVSVGLAWVALGMPTDVDTLTHLPDLLAYR